MLFPETQCSSVGSECTGQAKSPGYLIPHPVHHLLNDRNTASTYILKGLGLDSNRLERQFLGNSYLVVFSATVWLIADSVRVPPMGLEQESPRISFRTHLSLKP